MTKEEKQKEYEKGLQVRKILESKELKEAFVTPKELFREMFFSGKMPEELLGKRNLVKGYGFVKEVVEEQSAANEI